MAQPPTRYERNVDGDFYVVDGCCASCGVPAVTAPELFGGFGPDGSVAPGMGQCWVKRQPTSGAELDAMVATMARQDLGCIRYAGSDPAVVARLREIGESAQIDGERVAALASDSVPVEWSGNLVQAFLAGDTHRLLFWSAIAIAAVYIVGEATKSPRLVLLGPFVGSAIAWTVALAITWMRRHRAHDARLAAAAVRAATPTGAALDFASTDRIERVSDIARDVLARIVGVEYDELFVSDESSLWDFHTEPSNDVFIERIRAAYGVDVSDVTDGHLATILERIAADWPANRPSTRPGMLPGP